MRQEINDEQFDVSSKAVINTMAQQLQNIHDLFFKTIEVLPKQDIRSAVDKAKADILLKRSFKSK